MQATTVLLVEDEDPLREAVSRLLGKAGYRVLTAATGDQALAVAESCPDFGVLVTDIRLPDMYGRRLAQRINEARDGKARPIGIVYVSGNSEEVGDELALAAHERFLAKPFDLEELLVSIQEVLLLRARAPSR